jgi:hypothetical protein
VNIDRGVSTVPAFYTITTSGTPTELKTHQDYVDNHIFAATATVGSDVSTRNYVYLNNETGSGGSVKSFLPAETPVYKLTYNAKTATTNPLVAYGVATCDTVKQGDKLIYVTDSANKTVLYAIDVTQSTYNKAGDIVPGLSDLYDDIANSTVTVTFMNGGSSAYNTQTIAPGATPTSFTAPTAPDGAAEGANYNFKHWALSTDASEADADPFNTAVNTDTTYVAVYNDAVTYDITVYGKNLDGTTPVADDASTLNYAQDGTDTTKYAPDAGSAEGDTVNLTVTADTNFHISNISVTGAASYTADATTGKISIVVGTSPVTVNVTTVGKAITVTYNTNNNGTSSPASGNVTAIDKATKYLGAKMGALPTTPVDQDGTYEFAGWNTVTGGTGTAVDADTEITASLGGDLALGTDPGTLTLYAQWKLKPAVTLQTTPVGATVTYKADGTTVNTGDKVAGGTVIVIKSPTAVTINAGANELVSFNNGTGEGNEKFVYEYKLTEAITIGTP